MFSASQKYDSASTKLATTTCTGLGLDPFTSFAATLMRNFLPSWFLLIQFPLPASTSEIVDYSECVLTMPRPKGHIFRLRVNAIKIMMVSYRDDYLSLFLKSMLYQGGMCYNNTIPQRKRNNFLLSCYSSSLRVSRKA